jgi:hypothetical protein
MDWKDIVGPIMQSAAPTIGSILGGLIPFPGGSIIGQELGTIIARQFGVDPTPDAVNQAIQSAPSDVAAAKLQAAEAEAVAKWPALAQIAQAEAGERTAQSQAINATMQAEVAKGQPWWAWRNLWGYSVMIECGAVGCIILKDLATGNTAGVTVFLNATSFFYTWYGMRIGVLGYIFRGASNEKIAAVTGEQPGMIAQIIKAVKGR